MFIKHYKEVQVRVPDPLHPGHRVFDTRMDWSGAHSLSHNGESYDADEEGWFDVPDEVAAHFLNFPGWRTPDQVDEERSAGVIRADIGDATPMAARLKELEAENARLREAATRGGGRRGKKDSGDKNPEE